MTLAEPPKGPYETLKDSSLILHLVKGSQGKTVTSLHLKRDDGFHMTTIDHCTHSDQREFPYCVNYGMGCVVAKTIELALSYALSSLIGTFANISECYEFVPYVTKQRWIKTPSVYDKVTIDGTPFIPVSFTLEDTRKTYLEVIAV